MSLPFLTAGEASARNAVIAGLPGPRSPLPSSAWPAGSRARRTLPFWRLLEAGGNSITESTPGSGVGRVGEIFAGGAVPSEACRFGAFVDDIELFDAGFFRISPVEAQLLDPQQRMMLETSWQALEDAGIDPDGLKESLTGVYTGISNDEYRMLVVDSAKPSGAAESLYALSGTNLNGTSGRVSFVLGLMGPAKAVDAACASSLVSVHDAVADLQQGKADLAIAGGVQAILNGRIYELRADAMMLSPDGQSKAFDASANGYVRGEGCGVVVLKRLSEAEADGDRIWAVIRGAAVNHGGASSGLTVPHTPALVQVIEAALSQAGIPPSEVDYLEAHGTGTAVGDPIEIDAVADVYGRGRDAGRPLLVASVKTNIGHLESAARDCRADQDGAGGQSGRPSEAPAFPGSQPPPRLGQSALARHHDHAGLAEPSRAAAARGRELLRDIRDQRPCRGGGVPRAGWNVRRGSPERRPRSGGAGLAA